MLHKGKLQAALNAKRGQFTADNATFNDQLKAYRYALETLYQRYSSGEELEHLLPPDKDGMPSAGARPSLEFDRWLVSVPYNQYRDPLFPFGPDFANHEQSPQCAASNECTTT